MKRKKAHKNTLQWGNSVFTDPHKVIREIFDFAEVGFYRNFIKDILLYSTRHKKYKKEDMGNLLWLQEGVFCLLGACNAIRKTKKHSLMDIRNEDILNSRFYSNCLAESGIWSDFPRTLSESEVIDPYRTFRRIFKHRNADEWICIFKESLEEACGSYSSTYDQNTLLVYIQLSSLFEASYLIYIREIVHTNDWRINK